MGAVTRSAAGGGVRSLTSGIKSSYGCDEYFLCTGGRSGSRVRMMFISVESFVKAFEVLSSLFLVLFLDNAEPLLH